MNEKIKVVLDGKKVGEKLGQLTVSAKTGATIGCLVLKGMFAAGKTYVKDVVQSYKETVKQK